jgi:uncharacterized membrane-anchored protein
MRLSFAIPPELSLPRQHGNHIVAIASVDQRGVATLTRLAGKQPLARGERVIELTWKNAGWTVASDAWYFKEGEAQRWAKARYGEFRVDPNGKALLVGLRGDDLALL